MPQNNNVTAQCRITFSFMIPETKRDKILASKLESGTPRPDVSQYSLQYPIDYYLWPQEIMLMYRVELQQLMNLRDAGCEYDAAPEQTDIKAI